MALPEDAPGLISAIRTAAETDGQLDHTYRTASPDGGVEWRHARGSGLPGSEGGRRVICVITDITEIKEREEQLRFAELRARKRQPVVHMDLFRDVYDTYQNAYPPNLWSEYLPTSLEDAARYIRGKSRWK